MAKIDQVQVIYALPEEQSVFELTPTEGMTVREAIELSGILEKYPQIRLDENPLGIFSKRVKPEKLVHAGDRIEIYRPLLADPKEKRRQRISKNA